MTASSGHARSILRGHSMWPSQNRCFFSHKGKEGPAPAGAKLKQEESPRRRAAAERNKLQRSKKKKAERPGGPQI
jgi:hypothetical protein